MATARIISEADIVPNRADGYRLENGQLKNQEWVSPAMNTTADGALYLSVYDMAKWDQALYGEKLVKKPSLDQMWTPLKLNNGKTHPYGFGWQLEPVNGHKQVNHGGSLPGFRAQLARFVDDKVTVVVLTNGYNSIAGLSEILSLLIAIVLWPIVLFDVDVRIGPLAHEHDLRTIGRPGGIAGAARDVGDRDRDQLWIGGGPARTLPRFRARRHASGRDTGAR